MVRKFKVFKIRFPVTNKIGQLLVPHIRFVKYIRKGEQVVVESDRGLELVEFLGSSYENCPDDPLATFLRKPTYLDRQKFYFKCKFFVNFSSQQMYYKIIWC
jgi:cell fate regulator YaaT (PSP1 superfamily)